jgi:ERCC4-related helicase
MYNAFAEFSQTSDFGKLNVLITTAVAGEGVDVQACSFVVVFDGLTCVKNILAAPSRLPF